MLCQLCQVEQATIKVAHVVNDKRIEVHICGACAEQKGLESPMAGLPQMFENFIMELIGKDLFSRLDDGSQKECKACGMTWESFQKTGLFGCDICYQTFDSELDVVLRRIHGSNQHIGSRPKSQRHVISESELQKIKTELRKAVESENFERAAELRDMVRDAQYDSANENDGILR